MILLSACGIGALGIANLLFRRSLLGLLLGTQLLGVGATMMFVLAGALSGARVEGHLFGLFVTLMGIAQLAGGYALAVRLFYLKNRIALDDLQEMKR